MWQMNSSRLIVLDRIVLLASKTMSVRGSGGSELTSLVTSYLESNLPSDHVHDIAKETPWAAKSKRTGPVGARCARCVLVHRQGFPLLSWEQLTTSKIIGRSGCVVEAGAGHMGADA